MNQFKFIFAIAALSFIVFQTSTGLAANRSVDASMGANFANDIKNRLRNDFGPLFASVELSTAARGVERECLVKGHISRYEPGNRAARFLLIGLGAAHFEGTVDVVDVAGQRALISAPFDKLWAWGGILGASKGINGMIDEASASVAATLARAKGWTPESGK